MLKTPVLFLAFNRPETTEKVFDAIRMAQPARLFIALDGERTHVVTDNERCACVKEIVSNIDWPCEVKTLFRDENLGCKRAVSSAIDWFFSQVEEGIILEDDCLPSPDFFRFCEAMLQHYRTDTRIMQICGSNLHRGWVRDADYSYHLGFYGCIWGWATWRRAWSSYDVDVEKYPEIRLKGILKDVLIDDFDLMMRYHVMKGVLDGSNDTWDYQWTFAKLINNGLSITPNVNLVTNIGFGEDATRTKRMSSMSELEMHEFSSELKHPPYVVPDRISDKRFIQMCTGNWLKRIAKYLYWKFKQIGCELLVR